MLCLLMLRSYLLKPMFRTKLQVSLLRRYKKAQLSLACVLKVFSCSETQCIAYVRGF